MLLPFAIAVVVSLGPYNCETGGHEQWNQLVTKTLAMYTIELPICICESALVGSKPWFIETSPCLNGSDVLSVY